MTRYSVAALVFVLASCGADVPPESVSVSFVAENDVARTKAERDFDVFQEHCSDLFSRYSTGVESIDVYGDGQYLLDYPATSITVRLKDNIDFFMETDFFFDLFSPLQSSEAASRWAMNVARSHQYYSVVEDGIAYSKKEHAQPLCGWHGFQDRPGVDGFYSFTSRQTESNPYVRR